MEAFITYFIKSVIWLTGFALVYFIFLQNERFFMLKRLYLITGILVSFIFPLFTFHYNVELPGQVFNEQVAGTGSGVATSVLQAAPHKSPDYKFLLSTLYLTGLIILTFKSAFQLLKLIRAINTTYTDNLGQVMLIRDSRLPGSFSFFNYIFINPSINDDELEVIMNHELAHVTQKHWFDLLLAEFIRLFQWVNPFVWIYTGFIRQNHEYIADEAALERTPDPAIYKAVLVNQLFNAKVFCLSDSFNYSVNKKRFDMMKKIVSSPYRKLKMLIILPLSASIFYAFATPEYHYASSGEDNSNAITIYQFPAIIQKEIKGIVKDENGNPLKDVRIFTKGNPGSATRVVTGPDGKFLLTGFAEDASVSFYLRGFKPVDMKPDFKNEMVVKLVKDPDYKPSAETQHLVVVDGTVSEKSLSEVEEDLDHDLKSLILLEGKKATDKYGEKGSNGVWEITTRKKALELGEDEPFVVVEEMPMYPGGDVELLKFIAENTRYPEEARAQKIEGKVIVRFAVTKEGKVAVVTVIKGVHPLLDEEAVRVISLLKDFKPGMQSGKPVNVWYMAPVNFTLNPDTTK